MGDKVVRMRRPAGRLTEEHYIWKQAIFVLTSLPETPEVALRILEKAAELQRTHMADIAAV